MNKINNKEIFFERALFFSWYCNLGDCKFCYMSTQKDKILNPKKARRRFASIYAESLISKILNWKIEFVSGGYESYTIDELVNLVKGINLITNQKLWLNIGTLKKEELQKFLPYITGYAGTIETVNWNLRKEVCPSKHLEPILKTFENCETLGLQKAMTLIIGLGETFDDYKNLKDFIIKQKINRITFYALNPHPQTIFTSSPKLEYYLKWIKQTRKDFPNLDIIAGAWTDKINYYSELVAAGANSITKIPGLRKFGSSELLELEQSMKDKNYILKSNLTKNPKIDWDKEISQLDNTFFSNELKEQIKISLKKYIKTIEKNTS